MLQYYIDRVVCGEYSTKTRRVSMHKFSNIVLSHLGCYGSITTKVGFIKNVVVLDCDSLSNMMSALHWVGRRSIGYAAVMSSHDHYWVILDVAMRIRDALVLMGETPGVDGDYIRLCRGRKLIHLRAVPKRMSADMFVAPRFPETHTLKNPIIVKWYDEFKSYFESGMFNEIVINWRLRSGAAIEMAVSPTFGV